MKQIEIFLLIFITFLIIVTSKAPEKKSVQFKWTALECYADNEYNVNISCAVRAVRGQFGILEVNQTVAKQVNEVILNVKFFYKFGTIYRPYLIDFTVDICKIFAKDAVLENNIERIIKAAISTVRSTWVHPCPYKTGPTKVRWSGDETFTKLISTFKFVLPAGDHKWHLRVFDSKNHTFLYFICRGNIKALGLTDLSMLAMG